DAGEDRRPQADGESADRHGEGVLPGHHAGLPPVGGYGGSVIAGYGSMVDATTPALFRQSTVPKVSAACRSTSASSKSRRASTAAALAELWAGASAVDLIRSTTTAATTL